MEWAEDDDDMMEYLVQAEEERDFDEKAIAAAKEAERRFNERRREAWWYEKLNQGGLTQAELEAAVREAEEDRPALEQRIRAFNAQPFDPAEGYWSGGQFISYTKPGENAYFSGDDIERTLAKRYRLEQEALAVLRDYQVTQRQTKHPSWVQRSILLSNFWQTAKEVQAFFFPVQTWLWRTYEHSSPATRNYWVNVCKEFIQLAVNPHRNHYERYQFFKFLVMNGTGPDQAKEWCYIFPYNYDNAALRDLDEWMPALSKFAAGLPLLSSESNKLDVFFQRNTDDKKMQIPNIYSYERVWKE